MDYLNKSELPGNEYQKNLVFEEIQLQMLLQSQWKGVSTGFAPLFFVVILTLGTIVFELTKNYFSEFAIWVAFVVIQMVLKTLVIFLSVGL